MCYITEGEILPLSCGNISRLLKLNHLKYDYKRRRKYMNKQERLRNNACTGIWGGHPNLSVLKQLKGVKYGRKIQL